MTPETEKRVNEKVSAALKLLGDEGDKALLEVEVEEAPSEGRSATPFRVVARLSINNKVYHAEAVKPTPESAADRVRGELEAEIRRDRGRARRLWRRGSSRIKEILRFGR